jgi:hypothetical protein
MSKSKLNEASWLGKTLRVKSAELSHEATAAPTLLKALP